MLKNRSPKDVYTAQNELSTAKDKPLNHREVPVFMIYYFIFCSRSKLKKKKKTHQGISCELIETFYFSVILHIWWLQFKFDIYYGSISFFYHAEN